MKLNKEFWITVRREFEDSYDSFLCLGSNTFKQAWIENRKEINLIAKKYEKLIGLRESNEYLGYLFQGANPPDMKHIRLGFLDYLINKK